MASHEDACHGEEALEVDKAQDGDLFFHAARDDHILAVVVKLLQSWHIHVVVIVLLHLISLEVVGVVKNSHFELNSFFSSLLRLHIELDCLLFVLLDGLFVLLLSYRFVLDLLDFLWGQDSFTLF